MCCERDMRPSARNRTTLGARQSATTRTARATCKRDRAAQWHAALCCALFELLFFGTVHGYRSWTLFTKKKKNPGNWCFTKCHKHFKKFSIVVEAKQHPYKHVSYQRQWDWLCDRFASEKFQMKSSSKSCLV